MLNWSSRRHHPPQCRGTQGIAARAASAPTLSVPLQIAARSDGSVRQQETQLRQHVHEQQHQQDMAQGPSIVLPPGVSILDQQQQQHSAGGRQPQSTLQQHVQLPASSMPPLRPKQHSAPAASSTQQHQRQQQRLTPQRHQGQGNQAALGPVHKQQQQHQHQQHQHQQLHLKQSMQQQQHRRRRLQQQLRQEPAMLTALIKRSTSWQQLLKLFKGLTPVFNPVHVSAAITHLGQLQQQPLTPQQLAAAPAGFQQLVRDLAAAVAACTPEFGARQLANSIWALSRLGAGRVPTRRQRQELLEAFAKQLPHAAPQHVANVVAAVTAMEWPSSVEWGKQLLQAAAARLAYFKPQEIVILLHALPGLQAVPSAEWLGLFTATCHSHIHSYSLQELAMLGVGLAKLQYRPPQEWLAAYLHAVQLQLQLCVQKAAAARASSRVCEAAWGPVPASAAASCTAHAAVSAAAAGEMQAAEVYQHHAAQAVQQQQAMAQPSADGCSSSSSSSSSSLHNQQHHNELCGQQRQPGHLGQVPHAEAVRRTEDLQQRNNMQDVGWQPQVSGSSSSSSNSNHSSHINSNSSSGSSYTSRTGVQEQPLQLGGRDTMAAAAGAGSGGVRSAPAAVAVAVAPTAAVVRSGAQSLVNVLWAAATLGAEVPAAWAGACLTSAEQLVEGLTIQGTSTLLWAMDRLQMHLDERLLLQLLEHSRAMLPQANCTDLAMLAMGLGSLGGTAAGLPSPVSCSSISSGSGSGNGSSSGSCRRKAQAVGWLQQFMHCTAKALPSGTAADVVNLLVGLQRMCVTPGPRFLRMASVEVLHRLPHMNAAQLAATLLCMARWQHKPAPAFMDAYCSRTAELLAMTAASRGSSKLRRSRHTCSQLAAGTNGGLPITAGSDSSGSSSKEGQPHLRLQAGAASSTAHAQRQLLLYNPQSLANTLGALAMLGHTPDPCWCQRFLASVQAQLPHFAGRDFAYVVWALAVLDVQPSQAWMDYLLVHLGCHVPVMSSQQLSAVVWGLARLNHRPGVDLMQRFLARVAALTPQPSMQSSSAIDGTKQLGGGTGHSTTSSLCGSRAPPSPLQLSGYFSAIVCHGLTTWAAARLECSPDS